jgi:hypothetical protein
MRREYERLYLPMQKLFLAMGSLFSPFPPVICLIRPIRRIRGFLLQFASVLSPPGREVLRNFRRANLGRPFSLLIFISRLLMIACDVSRSAARRD